MSKNQQPIPIEEQLSLMANTAPVLLWMSGTDKRRYFFNAGWLRFTGASMEQEVGEGWVKGIYPDDRSRYLKIYHDAFEARQEFKTEYRLRRYDGRYCWLLDHGVPRYLEDGTFAGFTGSCMDIEDLLNSGGLKNKVITTEAFRNEQAFHEELATSNESLAAANEQLSITVDELQHARQQLSDINDDLEQKVKIRTSALEASESEQQALNEELASMNEELSVTNEELIQSQDQMQKLLHELAASEQKVRSIVASAPFPIGVYIGREMRIELLNQSIIDVWGKGGNLLGKTYAEVLPELAGTGIYEQLEKVYTTGLPYQARHQKVDLVVNGKLQAFYFNYDFTPLFDNDGKVYGVMNTAAEVTDLVNARLQVEQSQANLYNIIIQAPIAMCILLGPTHKVEVANNLIIDLWGKSREEVMGMPIFDALPDARLQGLETLLDEVYHTGITFDVKERPVSLLRNGLLETLYLDFVYQPYQDAAGNVLGVIATAIDVTAQVLSREQVQHLNEELAATNEELTAANEEQSAVNHELEALNAALKISQDELQLAINAAGLATWDLNPLTGKFTGNQLTKAWFGLQPKEEIELTSALAAIAESDRERVSQAIQWALNYNSGGGYAIDYSIVNPLDGTVKVVRAKGKALFNEQQQAIRMSGVLQDITEQKKDEQRKNDFIGIVSHELKTPLTSLKALLQVANYKLKTNEDAFLQGAVDKSNTQVKKMETMINGFLNISRLESGKMQIEKSNFDLAELVSEVIKETELTVSSHQIHFTPSGPIPVYADQEKIGSVISNLLSNAVKYSNKGTNIELSCSFDNGAAVLSVRDEGIGISEKDRAKLFERYCRVESSNTKHISGFGIGLYLSAEIIQRHGGRIWVESEEGRGSTFTFSLPQ